MTELTLADRRDAYARVFGKWPAGVPVVVRERDRDVLYATWVLGNDYRVRSGFYGAYPHGYLARVAALFPDIEPSPSRVLHAFSGSLPPGPYTRLDCRQSADIDGSVFDLGASIDVGPFDLVYADPPYTAADAVHYGTPMINRGKATRAIARVVRDGGFLVWLDTVWPMHRKDEWITVGRISLWRSTNHRARFVSIFQRVRR